jgi:hypothetical protein
MLTIILNFKDMVFDIDIILHEIFNCGLVVL